jgi:hypothetical protein
VDDLLRDLEQVRRYAATLSGVLADAAANVPDRATGEDATGAVRVVLDAGRAAGRGRRRQRLAAQARNRPASDRP